MAEYMIPIRRAAPGYSEPQPHTPVAGINQALSRQSLTILPTQG